MSLRRATLTGLWAGLLALAAASLCVGASRLPLTQVWAGLATGEGVEGLIVREIRLPRLFLSLMVGGALGLSGAAMQGLLRNPLAEPSIFGAPQAAALGAVIVLYFGLAPAGSWALPAAAIAGALLSVAALFALAGRAAGVTTLILAGLALSSLAGAGVSLVLNLSPNPFAVTEIVFWMLGSFEDRSMRHVLIAAPFLAGGAALLLGQGRGYRALTLGEETAHSLGVSTRRLRAATALGVALCVGAGVAVSGAIGFVGLAAPFFARGLVGGDPARALQPSALVGAALLTAADVAVRLIPATSEIRVGVLTALIGAPLFLWLALARRAAGGAP
jgi:iron complex transport system permease protein